MPISNVYNIDCMEGMKAFPDKFFDLAIVDPPYGFANHNIPNNSANKKIYADFENKQWGIRPNKEYFTELKRVSINQIIWGGNYFSELWQEGLNRGFIFWDKIQVSANHADGELAWTSFNQNAKTFRYCWSGNRYGPEHYIKGVGQTSNRIHPTQKPVDLYRWLLHHYAKPNDKILDTHLGSQSSRIAAYKLGFDFWGYEIDEDYFKQGCERFEKSIAMPLFDTVKPEQIKINL